MNISILLQFEVYGEGLCHPMVIGWNLVRAFRSEMSLPNGFVEVLFGGVPYLVGSKFFCNHEQKR